MAPEIGGSSRLTVTRAGDRKNGRYISAENGGILHTIVAGSRSTDTTIHGLRVSLNLLGDGYVEAVSDDEFRNLARQETLETHACNHHQGWSIESKNKTDEPRRLFSAPPSGFCSAL